MMILFVGAEYLEAEYYVRKLAEIRKDCRWQIANTKYDLQKAMIDHPETDVVVLAGHCFSSGDVDPAIFTQGLVEEIRESLWYDVKIIAAFPDEEFNQILVEKGCDEATLPDELGALLCKLAN